MHVGSSTLDQLAVEREIVNLLESSIEDTTVPDAIAAYATTHVGKPVTVRDAETLKKQLGIKIWISKQYGQTQVQWIDAKPDGQGRAVEHHLTLVNKTTHVTWPTAEAIRQKEPAYFSAAQIRNDRRRQLLTEHATLRNAIGSDLPAILERSIVYRTAMAVRQMRQAREELARLTDYDEPMSVAKYAIEKLVG